MNKKSTSTQSKILKVAGKVLASVLLLLCIVQLWLLVWGGDMIKSRLSEEISKGSDNLYEFNAEKVRPGLFGRSVMFRNAEVIPDTAKYRQLQQNNEADRRLYHFKIKKLKLSGIHIINLLFDNEIEINELILSNPDIKIYDHPETNKKEDPKAKFTLYSLFAPKYSSLELGSVNVTEGTLQIIVPAEDSLLKIYVNGFGTEISDIRVDSTNNKSDQKLFMAEAMELKIDSINFAVDKGKNDLQINKLIFNSKDEILKLNNLQLKPKAGKFEYAQQFGHEKDRVNLTIAEITGHNFSLIEFLQSGILNIQKLMLKNMDMYVFRDKRLELGDQYKKLPQELLRELGFKIKIDTLELNANKITYEEYHNSDGGSGIIYFTDIGGTISNITNIEKDSLSNQMKINAYAYLYGKSRLDADFTFHIFDKDNVFYYSGYLDKIDATTFNQMSVPVAGVKIESATINKMEFHASANSNISTGTMKLYYENLEIKIEDQGLKSFIANVLVLKNSNPQNGEFREGEMRFERDTRKAVTNYCWKTMLSGMKTSIGMGSGDSKNEEE